MISHSLIYFFVRFGNGVLAIATLAALTRLLSPSEYGVYAILVSVAMVVSSIFFQWIEFTLGRFYPNNLSKKKEIMDIVTAAFWVGAIFVAVFCIAAFYFREKFKLEPQAILVLFFLILALGRYILVLQIANSISAPLLYGMLSWTKSFVGLLTSVFLIHFGFGWYGALFGFFVGVAVATTIFEPKPRIGLPSFRLNMPMSMNMLRYSFPLTLNIIAGSVVDFADRFMIGSMLGISYVSPYAVAYDFVQLTIGPMMNIFILTAFPNIVKQFDNQNYADANADLERLGSNLLISGLPLVFLISILSGDLSKFILGAEYQRDAAMLMPWLAASIFVGVFKSYFLDVVFQLHHETKYLGAIAALMAIVNVVLNIILLPRFGIIAAAWSTLLAFLVGAIASWLLGRRLLKLPRLNNIFWKSIFVSFVILITIYLMTPLIGTGWLLVKAILSFMIYITFVFVLDIMNFRFFIIKATCNLMAFLKHVKVN